ncbi:DNA-binding MarR family transcriptional regulator [Kitasatospora sp. MAP12-15]|uniref:MarR family winged helix-turn-helix transcriptional regulator n=1 Tax=unclassified Kitasatospora TaxID=2633591 RepID=UPI0024736453|nr:MarR family transcriptional regulator [Kitasatospora sp. MAP12-44]MDH6108893.1 DNA-binding MarR family transcriptional regulator [Kitasatospora sp. MAP12-44]
MAHTTSQSPETSPEQLLPPPGTDLLQLDLQVCFALHATSRAFDRVYRRLLRDTGLTYPQYLAMMALWEHGAMPVKQLGELLRLDSGTLSPLLKRLDAAGLVQRERSPHDERSVIVRPTGEGAALRAQAERIPLEIIAASGLSAADAVELRSRLEQLTHALDAAADAGPEA